MRNLQPWNMCLFWSDYFCRFESKKQSNDVACEDVARGKDATRLMGDT